MNVRRSLITRAIPRRAGFVAAASGLLAATVLVIPGANAASAAQASPEAAAAVESQLGSHSAAGSYQDAATGRMVVNVTGSAAAEKVREAGAVAKIVKRSAAALSAATSKLNRSVRLAGTAWWTDPQSNQVVIAADSRVTGAKLAKLNKVAASLGDAVRVERASGKFDRLIRGGDAIYADSWRCSLGFNVRSGSTYYLVTAGHCTEGYPNWYTNSSRTTSIGPTAGTSFPGNDYGIVRYSNTSLSHPGTINLYNGSTQDITSAGNAYVGQSVRRSGSTTGVHGGSVTGLNATVNYGGGDIVYGLIRTNVCAEPGDSGGSLFAGSTALGLTSGGSGNCSSGGTTFFQPVTEALSAYGVSVY